MSTPIVAALGFGGPGAAFGIMAILFFLCFGLLLMAVPAILAFVILNRVPEQYRKQTPGLAFLLLIPFFSMIWAFFVHPRVAASLKAYFDAQNDQSVGDCGASLALWLCICSVCGIIPVIGMISVLAALILFIIFYVKAFDLSSRISNTAPPVAAPPVA